LVANPLSFAFLLVTLFFSGLLFDIFLVQHVDDSEFIQETLKSLLRGLFFSRCLSRSGGFLRDGRRHDFLSMAGTADSQPNHQESNCQLTRHLRNPPLLDLIHNHRNYGILQC